MVSVNVTLTQINFTAPVLIRLVQLADVTKDDETALFHTVKITRKVKPKSKINCYGEHSSRLRLIQQGYACRYMERNCSTPPPSTENAFSVNGIAFPMNKAAGVK